MDNKYLNAMKSLSIQSLYNAKSGHPGMAMSASNITYVLYTRHINISKTNPKWLNRDRFVLSGGHGCLSIYSIFHFASLIDKEEIKKFRKGSKWYPGHPEYEKDNYVDASTGPLGQGIANGVGMAIAQKYLQQRWSNIGDLVDHYTYVVCGDGDLQEGISYESMSIASKLNLNKLIILYDSNDYQLDSAVSDVNIENIKQRVNSQNWNYISTNNNIDEIDKAVKRAKKSTKPTFIEVKTIIGEGISTANSYKAHGSPINDEELKNFNNYYKVNYKNFEFEDDVYNHFNSNVVERGNKEFSKWEKKLKRYSKEFPNETKELLDNFNNKFKDFSSLLSLDKIDKKNDATKTYLKHFFNQISNCKDILTLSADLASTTNCKITPKSLNEDGLSPYIMMGVREFSMSAIQNGILYHGGLICFSGTFLSFVDYAKASVRVGAMTHLPSNYILTHDSYKVGADGPTHQPYDQIPMLRSIDNVYLLRPCNLDEALESFKLCLKNTSKTYCVILTRQPINLSNYSFKIDFEKGAAIILGDDNADISIIASGSEVEIALESIKRINDELGLKVKVISCPCLKKFLEQPNELKTKILSSKYGTISIEASSDNMWYELSSNTKKIKLLKATTFGYSEDGNDLYSKKGFNVDNIIKMCKEVINE